MSEELKPCPFCGGAPKLDKDSYSWEVSDNDFGSFSGRKSTMSAQYAYSKCEKCNFELQEGFRSYDEASKAEAFKKVAERWNTRAEAKCAN